MPGPTYAKFANTFESQGFDFTLGPGVQPSVCLLYTVPHVPTLNQVGILEFGTVGEPPFSLRDCIVEQPRLEASSGGQRWTLPVQDRRWKWKFAHISGSYNIRKPDGTYLREKTPQELAALLLVEMGETGYDVSRLPNDPRPERQWDDTPAAGELDRLCAELGCIVTLNPFLDRAEIWPVGVGATLPSGPTQGASYAPVKLATPSNIRIDAGETWFQDTFVCEAVGLDIDGKWKPIAQLSYAPASGCWGWPPQGFPRFTDSQTYTLHGRTLKIRDLAEATVFRCYRVSGLLPKLFALPWDVPGYNDFPHSPQFEPSSLKDFKITDELCDEEISTADGGLRRLPAVVYSKYWREGKKLMQHPIRYPGGFSFNTKHSILQFNDPLFQFEQGTNKVVQAFVYYECAFNAGSAGIMHRIKYENSTGAQQTPIKIIQRQEVLTRIIQRYDSVFSPTNLENNFPDANQRLQYWYNAELTQYNQVDGGTLSYASLMRIPLDGLTQQVTWSGGGRRAPVTIASQGQRHNRYIEPLDSYRDRLAAKRAEQIATRLAGEFAVRAIGGGVV